MKRKKKTGLFGGRDINTKTLIILLVAGLAGYYITKKILDRKKGDKK